MTNAEIQVNEYVRTRDGDIFKVADFYEKGSIYTMVDERGVWFGNPRKVVKKHSFNIIDLIEVGDYVNGNLISEVDKTKKEIRVNDYYVTTFRNEHIQTVVTKERFASAEYRVETN